MNYLLIWIQSNSVISGFFANLILFGLGYLIVDRINKENQYWDNKPYISVTPSFKKHNLPNTSGYIEYVEIGNFGKSVAIDVVIEFLYRRVWENPHVEELISISGRYEMKYLPPSNIKKYDRPVTRYSIQEGWYPEYVKISYVFRGKVRKELFRLNPEKVDDRGYELEEYKHDTNREIREAKNLKPSSPL